MEGVEGVASIAATAATAGTAGTTSHSSRFPCNTCSRTFASNELQRAHMHSPWHVTNLRRRVAGLPALPEAEHNVESRTKTTGKKDEVVSDSRQPEPRPSYQARDRQDLEQIAVPPTQCLFCSLVSLSLDGNLSHMASVHSLFIPSPGQLIDVESFLGYLALLVFVEHECLYCGAEKADVESAQAHMRDKGHCMIQLDVESELIDFWDFSDEDGQEDAEDTENDSKEERSKKGKANLVKISETEMRLPSGAVANSRSASAIERVQLKCSVRRSLAKNRRIKQMTLEQDSQDQLEGAKSPVKETEASKPNKTQSDRQIAVRSEMGLVGLPDDRRRALQVTERKMKRKEAIATAAHRHAIEQQPVKTMYYKTENPIYQAG